ncbi:MAG: hypothetical protein AB7I48_08805 [Planctomycetaceae bacterium]
MIPTSTDRSTFWETIAESRWGKYLSGVEFAAITDAFSRFDAPAAALEVGCEGGRWSRFLADAGWMMTCIDVNPAALAVCQDRIPAARCPLHPRG